MTIKYLLETSIIILFFSFIYAQDVTGGYTDGSVTDAGWTDGGITDGGWTDGGLDFLPGCMDECATNFNEEADLPDGSCVYSEENFNCECFYTSQFLAESPQFYNIYQCFLGVVYAGYDCSDMTDEGYDCNLIESCGFCPDSCDDYDGDGVCDDSDSDDDNDGVNDSNDYEPFNPYICTDNDGDGCDDCSSGQYDPSNDGNDYDADGICDSGDADDDNDGVIDQNDCAPLNYLYSNYDCNGICGGNAQLDECGICNGNGIPEDNCDCYGNTLDCTGECGGNAVVDLCNICNGNNNDMDCNGECFGSAELDDCNICNGNNESMDCAGICSGTTTVDCEGVCGGDGTVDECGVCNGEGIQEPYCQCNESAVLDCSGDGDCFIISWIGDGYCDGVNQPYGADLTCYDNDGGDCDELPPEFDIDLSLIYPTDQTIITDYNDVDIEWSYEGSYDDPVTVSVIFKYNYGGGFKEVANNIDIEDGYVNVDLSRSSDGESFCTNEDPYCIESIFGYIKIIASDSNGNTALSECSDLIIGNPEGDIGMNWLDYDEDTVVIDWSWLNNHEIILHEDALTDLNEFNSLRVYDNNGINTHECDETPEDIESGIVELLNINLHNLYGSHSYSLDCGFDYCYENGDRIVGYQEGNRIVFYGVNDETNDYVEIYPVLENGNEIAYFDNNASVILNFNISGNIFNFNNDITVQDERDFDSFSVFNKMGSIQMRDCEIIQGCTDINAINYDEDANQLDCSCYFDNGDNSGCGDDGENNYPLGCIQGIDCSNYPPGCIPGINCDSALNFNPLSSSDDGSCLYGSCIVGCMDPTGCNHNPLSIVDNGCLYGNDCMMGCTDNGNTDHPPGCSPGVDCTNYPPGCDPGVDCSSACNFDGSLADGWIDDGSCSYTLPFSDINNPGWCPLDTLYDVTTNTYYDRLPAMQQNSNVQYRVWLLDEFQNEILKTFESNGLNILVCEDVDCTGEFGGTAYTDDCGECITEDNICDDCYVDSHLGDSNGDGLVNVQDVVTTVNYILWGTVLSPLDLCAADINGDGFVNVQDVVTTVNYILGE